MAKQRNISDHDKRELDAFQRMLTIFGRRMDVLQENRYKAMGEACLEVYGDKSGEGNKHHQGYE